ALSLVGRFGMAVAGFELGRRGGPLFERAVPSWERAHATSLVERWGAVAIIVSRPVPILAETTTILAGASGLRRRVALAAAFVGSLPEAVAYGLVGAAAASAANGALVWLGFLVVAGAFRLFERRQRLARAASAPPAVEARPR
nr:VTT domain-containing protein [Actinomycetota bacterium]